MKSVRFMLSVVVLMSLSSVAFAQADAQKPPSDAAKGLRQIENSGRFVGRPRDNPPAATRDGGRDAHAGLAARDLPGKRAGA